MCDDVGRKVCGVWDRVAKGQVCYQPTEVKEAGERGRKVGARARGLLITVALGNV